jgi:site-specific DNA-methyltransferase (adenine-specific)
MKPYYQDEAVTLYHGDCREVLPSLSGIDLAVTSPPYNLGRPTGAYANMRDGYASHSDDLEDAEYVAWQREVVSLMWAALSEDGAIFYNHKPLIRDGAAVLPLRLVPEHVTLRQVIVWNRRGGFNHSPGHFCPWHEWILLLAKRRFQLTSRAHSAAGDVWDCGIESGVTGHPCPYPLALPQTAIAATPARTVLDPFAGSGTTLVAAKNLGRRAIGIEVEERYCEIAARRLGQGVLPLAPTVAA